MAVPVLAAAAVVSAVGAISDSQHQASADKYNARVAEQNSGAALSQASAAAQLQQEQAQREIGATTAAYGASGITMDGTAIDVLRNSASMAERDKQNILYKGQLQAAGYQDEAQLDRMSASAALTGGYYKAAGAVLKGGSSIYGKVGTGLPKSPNRAYGMDEL